MFEERRGATGVLEVEEEGIVRAGFPKEVELSEALGS